MGMNGWREVWFRLRYQWQGHYLLPLVIFVPAMVALLAIFWRDPLRLEREPGEAVAAQITSMRIQQNRYQGRSAGLVVVAKSDGGARGSRTVFPSDIEGCRVGDAIRAEQVGVKLYLYPEPCAN